MLKAVLSLPEGPIPSREGVSGVVRRGRGTRQAALPVEALVWKSGRRCRSERQQQLERVRRMGFPGPPADEADFRQPDEGPDSRQKDVCLG